MQFTGGGFHLRTTQIRTIQTFLGLTYLRTRTSAPRQAYFLLFLNSKHNQKAPTPTPTHPGGPTPRGNFLPSSPPISGRPVACMRGRGGEGGNLLVGLARRRSRRRRRRWRRRLRHFGDRDELGHTRCARRRKFLFVWHLHASIGQPTAFILFGAGDLPPKIRTTLFFGTYVFKNIQTTPNTYLLCSYMKPPPPVHLGLPPNEKSLLVI